MAQVRSRYYLRFQVQFAATRVLFANEFQDHLVRNAASIDQMYPDRVSALERRGSRQLGVETTRGLCADELVVFSSRCVSQSGDPKMIASK